MKLSATTCTCICAWLLAAGLVMVVPQNTTLGEGSTSGQTSSAAQTPAPTTTLQSPTEAFSGTTLADITTLQDSGTTAVPQSDPATTLPISPKDTQIPETSPQTIATSQVSVESSFVGTTTTGASTAKGEVTQSTFIVPDLTHAETAPTKTATNPSSVDPTTVTVISVEMTTPTVILVEMATTVTPVENTTAIAAAAETATTPEPSTSGTSTTQVIASSTSTQTQPSGTQGLNESRTVTDITTTLMPTTTKTSQQLITTAAFVPSLSTTTLPIATEVFTLQSVSSTLAESQVTSAMWPASSLPELSVASVSTDSRVSSVPSQTTTPAPEMSETTDIHSSYSEAGAFVTSQSAQTAKGSTSVTESLLTTFLELGQNSPTPSMSATTDIQSSSALLTLQTSESPTFSTESRGTTSTSTADAQASRTPSSISAPTTPQSPTATLPIQPTMLSHTPEPTSTQPALQTTNPPSPTQQPTAQPSVSPQPTTQPSVTVQPTTHSSITLQPTTQSSVTLQLTTQPSATLQPTNQPSSTSTNQPTGSSTPNHDWSTEKQGSDLSVSSGGMSSGEKAALGVFLTLLLIVVVVAAVVFYRRRYHAGRWNLLDTVKYKPWSYANGSYQDDESSLIFSSTK